jgi:acetyl-CoA acetyltransferase family protein
MAARAESGGGFAAEDKDIVICGGARTPMIDFLGRLKDVSAIELGAIATRAALERSRVAPEAVDHVFFGNALQTSGDAIYGARHVGLKAGIPIAVPALTVNRLCGSGIQSVITAAQTIRLGEATICVAGGMENMSQAPHVIRGARSGLRLGEGKLEDSLMVALHDSYCGYAMAETAENLAKKYGISREAQDEFALLSQTRAGDARAKGRLGEEIVPVSVPGRGGRNETVSEDDHLRPDTTLEALARLKPAFSKDGMVTAGNASGIVDGAAAVVVTSAASARERGLPVLGRIRSWAVHGVDPALMGIGPVPAIRGALAAAGLALADLHRIEVNEAFAAQYLAVERELGLDRARVNVNGGAIALGHPLAASGTRLILTLLLELWRGGGGVGVASACIGGGQGIAMIVEA